MRTLDDIDKEIIYNINKENKKNLKRMDSVIGHLFKPDKSALLLHDNVYLFTSDETKTTEMLVLSAQIISLIDSLQKEGYIYLIPNKDSYFLQDGVESSITINTHGDIGCCLGYFKQGPSNNILRLDIKDISYISVDIPKALERALKLTLCNYVFPTAKLHQLVNNNFAFGEELRFKKELKYTRIGLCISLLALAISLGAPFYMTKYNNKHAVTTINSNQIKEIEKDLLNILNKKISNEIDTNCFSNYKLDKNNSLYKKK